MLIAFPLVFDNLWGLRYSESSVTPPPIVLIIDKLSRGVTGDLEEQKLQESVLALI